MTTPNEQSESQFLTLPRVLIVVAAVCLLMLLAIARPAISRASQSAPAVVQADALVQPAPALSQPTAPKPAKPRAGKPKIAKDI